ncbi:MAG TPA: NAD(P)H-dependent oxidoreductase subunit E, partial [Gemmatimonadales bacterium]
MSGHATAPGAETHQPVFTGKALERLEALFPKYPNRQACLLPALWIIQEERGWISPQAMAEVGERLGLTPAYVKGVVTFYTMYHQHPVGTHFVQVCTTTPCNVCGAEGVAEAFLKATGCK